MTEFYIVVTAGIKSLIVTMGTEDEVKKYLGIEKFNHPHMNVMLYALPRFFSGCVKNNVVHADYDKKLIVERYIDTI